MNKEGQLFNWLGCDYTDSCLDSITELWEQHLAALQTSIIEICNRELRRSEIPSHLATPSGKRKKRFTSAQKAIQALLNSVSHSTSMTSTSGRVTRARAKKVCDEVSSQPLPSTQSSPPPSQPQLPPAPPLLCLPPPSPLPSTSPPAVVNVKEEKKEEVDNQEEEDWTTDDEAFESIDSIGDTTYQRMIKKKSLNSSTEFSTVKKKKRKKTEYFTPSIPKKSTRITRATANKIEITPKKTESATKNNLLLVKASSVTRSATKKPLGSEKSSTVTTSGSSIASSVATIASVGRTDSMKGKRAIPRTCTTPDQTKALTASASKRRLEEEEKRQATLALMKEKEEKVIHAKQENLKMKSQMTKAKNEEKRRKIELIKKKEEEELREKRLKEQSKMEEIEKKRREKEEARRREFAKYQEASKKRQIEFDLRKKQEEDERKARLLKQEEQIRRKKEEEERLRMHQENILRMIAKHNSNLQKCQNNSIQPKMEPQPQLATSVPPQFKQPLPPTLNEVQPAILNKTFDKEAQPIKKEETPPIKEENYEITPPPKVKSTPVNYDISDIKSDDDTDDEDKPRKQIPSWAKGNSLIAALDRQFAKSRRAREREIREIFPHYDFSIQLSDIFKSSHIVHPKYQARSSSAVWSSPPCNNSINCSMVSDEL